MSVKKVVLGFSGGLDTTYCALHLNAELGYELVSVTVDTGGFSPDELARIEAHAYRLGVRKHITIDAVRPYYDRILRYLIFGNVLKNNTYPLSVSAERLSQALAIAEVARAEGADAVAHGSTGAGNDQVRFDMIFQIELPGVQIITPIRDQRLSREAEIEYLRANGVEMSAEKAAYSINKGLWGTSVGGRETLRSHGLLPESAWPTPVSKTEPEALRIRFEQGEPVALNGQPFDHPTELIRALQALAAPFGIGRDIHVGDTIIGIKGRVGFEAAAPILLLKAHHALEKHVLTKWQLQWKDTLAQFYGNWLHEGQILDPVMRDIEAFLQNSQRCVSGEVFLELHPYHFLVAGIESPHDLMSGRFGAYGEMNQGWTGEDVKGFTRIFGQQTRIWNLVNDPQNSEGHDKN
ncbi:MAG: argininosuccinate synthase [Saprospiraceae bacterium]|nr:argininosuccinate synthase [Saprospiraceae bacterium]